MTTPELEAALAAAHAENKELKDRIAASQQATQAVLTDHMAKFAGFEQNAKILESQRNYWKERAETMERERDEAQARLKEARAALRKLASATEVYDLWDCRREAQSLLEKLNEAQ
jgi:chromosome segregation ATPase